VRGFSRLLDIAMLARFSDSGECSLAKNSPIREPILGQVSRSLAEALMMPFEKVARYSYRVSKVQDLGRREHDLPGCERAALGPRLS
jgi:hypothetical protein